MNCFGWPTCPNCGVETPTLVERGIITARDHTGMFRVGVMVCAECAPKYEAEAEKLEKLEKILDLLDSIDTRLWRIEP